MEDNQIKETLSEIARHFSIQGKLSDGKRFPIGNINSTYFAAFEDGDDTNKYVIQKVNTYVFKFPVEMMKNIAAVTGYLKAKGCRVLDFLASDQGEFYYISEDGSFWRVYRYIEGRTFNYGTDIRVLYGAGRAFGEFQRELSDFDASLLYDTFPGFHDTKDRFEKFRSDLAADVCGRAAEVGNVTEYLLANEERGTALSDMARYGELPLRVTHNDTKINNVLFDTEGARPLVVMDLDTVMPGLAAYDFGDAIRSAACTTDEDETDLSIVKLDIEKYRSMTNGFVSQVADRLSDKELELLPLGAYTMTYELVLRFLNDYINGDKYFTIRRPLHNIERARCELALLKDMELKFDEMQEILNEAVKASRA